MLCSGLSQCLRHAHKRGDVQILSLVLCDVAKVKGPVFSKVSLMLQSLSPLKLSLRALSINTLG